MEGVRTKYGDDRVPVLALKAGVDQLLNPPDLDVAWNAVLKAVQDGELTEARLDESMLRILRLKARLRLFERAVRQPGAASTARSAPRRISRPPTGSPSGRRRCWSTRASCCRCPAARTGSVLVVGADPASPSGTTGPPTGVLAEALTELGFTATALSTGTAPSAANIAEAVAAAQERGRGGRGRRTTSRRAARSRPSSEQLVATGRPVVALADPQPVRRGPTALRPGAHLARTPGRTSNCGPPRG